MGPVEKVRLMLAFSWPISCFIALVDHACAASRFQRHQQVNSQP
jgi:hypothetical protein